MSTRLDKYVWSVRLSKTRSKAAEAISKGRVRLNGEHVKPAKDVKVGDEINITKHTAVFTFKVLQLLDRRIGAKLVPEYLLDTVMTTYDNSIDPCYSPVTDATSCDSYKECTVDNPKITSPTWV